MVFPFSFEKEENPHPPTTSNAAAESKSYNVYHLKELRWAGSEMFSNIFKRSPIVAPTVHKQLYLL